MKKLNLPLISFLSALGIAVYVTGVALLMQNSEQIFGKMDNLLGPVAFLLLFVVSAAVCGALALGKPALLYFNGQKKEAVKLFLYTVAWVFVITMIVLIIQLLLK